MSYPKERGEFLIAFAREFPDANMGLGRELLRLASQEQRWNEVQCSVDIGEEETARQEELSTQRMEKVQAICARIGGKLIENGDPRGYPFLLVCPSGRTYDWGGRGLGVPGKGLTVEVLEGLIKRKAPL